MKIFDESRIEKSLFYKSSLMKEVIMRNRLTRESTHHGPNFLALAVVLITFFLFFTPLTVSAFTLNVVGCDSSNTCNLPVSGFRWLLEEDNTTQSPPGVRVGNSISLTIHNSHAPVAANGVVVGSSASIAAPDASKRYYLSILPDSGFSLGGTQIGAGQASATVYVHQYPIPTAQISVYVFKDHDPINNIPDVTEIGLEGFSLIVFDQAGQMSQDAFGNPLGTTYNLDGSVLAIGNNVITTDATGNALIKYLPPGKYGIRAVPPGDPSLWIQTATIEGTPGIDAWVKANEPPIFIEGFGTGFKHVFIGFVKPSELPWGAAPPAGTATITGRNVYNHFGRPPDNQGFFAGPPVSECWIGLNDLALPSGKGLIAVPCNGDSYFTIPGVPLGTYQLVTWDKPLDALFGFNTVSVTQTGTIDLGSVLSFRWFGTFEGSVFYDTNQNGFRDANETGLSHQVVNIRFRDGSMYQTTLTDTSGEYQFAEVFPFFKWLVTEVDYTRYKPTGMTTAVDYGGAIPPANGWITPSFGVLNPQPQAQVNPNTGNSLSRTEKGPVLLEAMMLFLNQTNVIDWGKIDWGPNENGGLAGIVYYATTRAENDPRLARNEGWEPGIPRVQVNLYRSDGNGNIVDANGNGQIDLADVDNYPLGWSKSNRKMGPEDANRNGPLTGAGVKKFNKGDAVAVTWTDSWDDNKPTGCIQTLPPISGVQPCYDNYGTWNQVRPGVFDGGYAFGFLAGETLAPGYYIVEVVPPPGYEVVKEEDKNVDFGDEYIQGTLAVPPACVGTFRNTGVHHIVPPYLALFPGQQIPTERAGEETPLCTMKEVFVEPSQNTGADFFLFTEVPKAARVVGFANNDLSAEFRAGSPIFGEKASPSWIPVSFQDWQGNELNRVYADEFGSYNALLPSTFSVNVPIPTGVSPNIITLVLNHPFLPDGTIDPFYDSKYSVTPWTLDYWPGKTLYADTPMVPVSAFTVVPQNGPDVEPVTRTPVIKSVDGNSPNGGPVMCSALGSVTITSMGLTQVLNPDFDPAVSGSQALITRDYGFGTVQGTVVVGTTPLTVTSWTDASITATVPAGATTGQLMVTRGDSLKTTETGITLHVSADACATVRWVLPASTGTPIQNAIDAANAGDLIIVKPGTYRENAILYKPIKLQGSGEGSTIIFANPSPADRLQAWHAKIQSLLGNDPFVANEAPGIMVLGTVPGFVFNATNPSLIDGFKIFGALQGGGIFVNTNIDSLTISNNRITGNQGSWGGGIAVGTPDTGASNLNPNLKITYNRIVKNGGVQGGGGIVLNDGADDYIITKNIIGGNFARYNGGGISHYGLSNNGIIVYNRIIFNEVAFGGAAFTDGAGIFVGSSLPLPAVVPPPPVIGAGNVTINANLIQGNLAGVGNGGGIRAAFVNGQDVLDNPGTPSNWYKLNIFNNFIVNNTAGVAGGGIALQDAVAVNIVNNTIVNNDSTATGANAFGAGAVDSTPQGAGIVSGMHSADLALASEQTFTNPLLRNNIIRNNRSFYTTNGGAGGLLANPVDPVWDLWVKGATTPTYMTPQYNLLTSLTSPNDAAVYDTTNITTTDKIFLKPYVNQLLSAAVIDEGGNFITIRHKQIKENLGDYHLRPNSPAIGVGNDATVALFPDLARDYDGQARPSGTSDMGGDEYYTPVFSELFVFSPDGGEVMDEQSVFEILWGAPAPGVNPSYSKFTLQYSTNGDKGWKAIKGAKKIAGNSSGLNSFNWTVHKISGKEDKNNCLVKVTAFDAAGKKTGFFDTSDAPFTIRQVLP
jgi:large repetitive protein